MFAYLARCRSNSELASKLDKLKQKVEDLQSIAKTIPPSRLSHAETTLIQHASDVLVEGQTMYTQTQFLEGGGGSGDGRVGHWINALRSIRNDQFQAASTNVVANVPDVPDVSDNETSKPTEEDSDDDLEVDLAKAALNTGTKAFDARDWSEADSLLQEAVRILLQLSKQQRVFCDIFKLHYRLAICAYYTSHPTNAEDALASFMQQSATSDENQKDISNATHLLAYLHVRMGQIHRAQSECEKALQARRRLMGKHHDASLESLALMARIHGLQNNRARATSYLAMIPDDRKAAMQEIVEESLGKSVERPEMYSPLTPTATGDSTLSIRILQRRSSAASSSKQIIKNGYSAISGKGSRASTPSFRHSLQSIPSDESTWDNRLAAKIAEDRRDSKALSERKPSTIYSTEKETAYEAFSTDPEVLSPVNMPARGNLSRKEILDKIGCQPKDRVEDAVCEGDHAALVGLLGKEKGFWRSKMRKRGRPERLTALHFAALFGEKDMARRLLEAGHGINEIPYGYSTILTPLTLAIGARQVEMVDYLIANGARPTEPDTWSSLAGHLMNRSWLMKTMSENERDFVPDRIIAIFETLLRNGWDINAPFESSGRTVLHQAVSFWTGSYQWDLTLRTAMVSFLCEKGANAFQANSDGKTPYDLATSSGHEDLVNMLGSEMSTHVSVRAKRAEPVELPSEVKTPT